MEIRHFSIMLHRWFIIKGRSNIGSTKLMLKKKGYMLSGSVANENLCVFSSLVYPSLSLVVHLHHSPSLPILPFFFPLLLLILLPPLPFPARVYTSWRKRMYSGHHDSWYRHAACHRGRMCGLWVVMVSAEPALRRASPERGFLIHTQSRPEVCYSCLFMHLSIQRPWLLHLPPWQLQVCSLYLWVHFCFVDMLTCVVF